MGGYVSAISGNVTIITIAAVIDLALNDFVIVQAHQTSGAALNVNVSGVSSPVFGMVKVA